MGDLDVDGIMKKVKDEAKIMRGKGLEGTPQHDMLSAAGPETDWGPVSSFIESASRYCETESDFFQQEQFNKSILNTARFGPAKRVGRYIRRLILYMLGGPFNIQISFNWELVSSMNGIVFKTRNELASIKKSINMLESSVEKMVKRQSMMMGKKVQENGGEETRTVEREEKMEEEILFLRNKTDELTGVIASLKREIEGR